MRRFFRDAGILLAFCGAFYFLTIFVSRLDGDSGNETDFSRARKRADLHFQRKDWNSAAVEFRKLTTQDPYDGHAWFNYANCFLSLRDDAIRKLNGLTGETNPDPDEIEAAKEEVRYNIGQAYKALLKVREFARYRAMALLRLAAIATGRNDYSDAVDFLEVFIDEGNYTPDGLDRYTVFGAGGAAMVSRRNTPSTGIRLHGESRFWDLVEREKALRLGY